MEIEFSKHALDQLKIRSKIKRFMIIKTLREPDEVKKSFRGRQLYQKRFNDEVLEIVTIKEHNKILVITEYFLEQ